MNSNQKIKYVSIILLLAVMVSTPVMAAKNVIVMVPDGCAQSIQTAARWYKQHALEDDQPLAFDEMGTCGMVKTYMANSVITGSAAAATAFASGHKTSVRFLGVGPSQTIMVDVEDEEGNVVGQEEVELGFLTGFEPTAEPFAPLESVLEAAKQKGMSVGLISTSRITHATPAAYACHIDDRGKDNEIMEHLVYQDIDVVFGGGARHLIPKGDTYTTTFGDEWGGKRTDGENLMDVLNDRGYKFVDSKAGLDALKPGKKCKKVWGMFDDSHMDAEIDRHEFHPSQPSIAEMTAKAIEILSKNKKGFFLMVEGSQIDWAGHANDPIYMITDFLAFDESVKVAMDFAKKTDTAIHVYPDHNTGAMSIGHEQSEFVPHYTDTRVEDLIEPLLGMKLSASGLTKKIEDGDVKTAISDYWGIDITTEDHTEIMALYGEGMYLNTAIAKVISKNYTVFGWTTNGHSGEDVPMYSYYKGKPVAVGLFDNTDLAALAAKALSVQLRGSADWMEFPDSILDMTDPENPVASFAGGRIMYPVSKDLRIIKGRFGRKHVKNLVGITVWAPQSGKVYIPRR